MEINSVQIELALSHVEDPDLHKDLISLGMIRNIQITGTKVSFDLVLTTPACPMKDKMKQDCIEAIHKYVSPNMEVEVNFASKVVSFSQKQGAVKDIQCIIAIGSGKGGVGKSTVAANLAVSLAKSGASVGLLDADIYGPSIPTLFNAVGTSLSIEDIGGSKKIVPLEKGGIKIISVGFLVEPKRALVWRGPMASNALKQLILDVKWGALDYLIVDMPPGTGDIQLTLASLLSIDGVVMVSSPQQLAIDDVRRAVSMYTEGSDHIPVLGLVANMAYFIPQEFPDHKYFIFGKDGCKKLAEELHIPLLAEIPLVQSVNQTDENGMLAEPGSDQIISEAFDTLAQKIAQDLAIRAASN